MKVALFDLENQIAPPLLEEALDLVADYSPHDDSQCKQQRILAKLEAPRG